MRNGLKLIVIISLSLISSCRTSIDISNFPVPVLSSFDNSNDSTRISLSIVETGHAKSLEAFMYRGGSFWKIRKLSHVAVLIQHPSATFIIDTGLGSHIKQQIHDNFSWWNKLIYKFKKSESLKDQLEKHNFNPQKIDYIIPTHFHYDHVGGIEEFPDAEVWISPIAHQDVVLDSSFMIQQYDANNIKWHHIDFINEPYETYQKHADVFNDGSVILVPLPGHTKGSIGIFINLQSGKRYFFTGDLTWAQEGFIVPSEKHRVPRNIVDDHRIQIQRSIFKVHHLMIARPNLVVIPAHDYNAQKQLAHYPVVEW